MSHHPIEDLGFLSDCHTAALVDRDGTVVWWCLPRFDGDSVFAGLLDADAGHFALTPRDVETIERRYEDHSLVLTATFTTATGVVEVTDALLMGEGVRHHDLGLGSPHVLVRGIRCTDGHVDLDLEFAPRHEYGLALPIVEPIDGGVYARGGATALRLSAPVEVVIEGRTASGRLRLEAGERAGVAVSSAHSWEPPPDHFDTAAVFDRLDDTLAAWSSWGSHHQAYDGPYGESVAHSGRVLQGLTFQPTGAIVAAATTSLPEVVGGDRNWDYRYAWIRDASLTLHALWVAACPDEAEHFFDYLTNAASSFEEDREVQVMFGIQGERDLHERELPWLSGWRDSAPVRVGNGAWTQRQLDVYGSLLDAVHRLRDVLGAFTPAQCRLLAGLADVAARVWTEPDDGIWEIRGEPRHHVYSKVMCWVAVDRAIALADRLDAADRVPDWEAARNDIHASVLAEGWNPDVGAFTQSYGSDVLDAAVLTMPIVGFLPADDERVSATIEAIERDLTDESGLVYRYRTDDGLEGDEGAFLLCAFWLAEAHALAGRTDRARDVFDRAAGHANDLGLLAEEVDTEAGELRGNFPQAFSHVGLVNAAWAIARAEGAVE